MILHLPAELTIKCLQQAKPIDIACKAFNDLVKESLLLQYELILDRYGYDDAVVASKASTSERLDWLLRHVDGWRKPRLDLSEATVVYPNWGGSTYELQGGMFIAGHSLGVTRHTRMLTFLELPWRDLDMNVNLGGVVHEIPDLGVDTQDFQVDPSQNLLVLVGAMLVVDNVKIVRIYFRAIDTNGRHPLAQKQSMDVRIPAGFTNDERVGFIIQIMDDVVDDTKVIALGAIVAFYTQPSWIATPTKVMIFNWQIGQTYASIEASGIDSLVFLDQTTFLLPRRTGAPCNALSLDVFKFSRTPLLEDFQTSTKSSASNGGVTPLASFQLPELGRQLTAIIRTVARCEPALSYRTLPAKRTPILISPERTFWPSQSSRIITLSLTTLRDIDMDGNGLPMPREYTVIISAEAVRKLTADIRTIHPDEPTEVPWGVWGPKRTSWLKQKLQDTYIVTGDEWAYSIESQLPCRATTTKEVSQMPVSGVMLDEERVIVVSERIDDPDNTRFHVFNM
ncbi:hypothetical protein FRB96_000155 [Tulasnella sp. 330]|nr:hypothetical protein FRB96_000155 [Tulasnella sp. 330]